MKSLKAFKISFFGPSGELLKDWFSLIMGQQCISSKEMLAYVRYAFTITQYHCQELFVISLLQFYFIFRTFTFCGFCAELLCFSHFLPP